MTENIDSLKNKQKSQYLNSEDTVLEHNSDRNLEHNSDRNFDNIAEHFAHKVYGGLKGDIRLAVLRRDLERTVHQLSRQKQRPLRILDIGAGLAQLSIELAQAGHDVTINDISINMIAKAKQAAALTIYNGDDDDIKQGNTDDLDKYKPQTYQQQSSRHPITWLVGAYQSLEAQLTGSYDLILCHAVLEWLDNPKQIMAFFRRWLSDTGYLSLCFYNPVSFVYRNLIMGNFNLLNNPNYTADNKKSLTPNHPVAFDEVVNWLDNINFNINTVSGLRVFHDYAPLKRGGHQNPADVIEMEVRYSSQEPYKWLGRYLHIVATPKAIDNTIDNSMA